MQQGHFDGSEKYWPFDYEISDRVKDELFKLFDEYYYKSTDKQLELTNAALLGREALVDRALATGATINGVSGRGLTALQDACVFGNPNAIALLIKKGADVNQVEQKGRNSLRLLLRMHETSVKKEGRQLTTSELLPCLFLLICAGADPNIKDNYGHSVLDWIPCQKFDKETAELVSRTFNAKSLSKEERKTLLDDIYEFQMSEQEKRLKNDYTDDPRNFRRIWEGAALVKKRGGGFTQPKLKDIYREYVA